MHNVNILTRRAFLDRSAKAGLAVVLSTLTDIPFVVKRALAEGTIGLNGKKLLFVWLRFGNDALNSVIPIGDTSYGAGIRPTLAIAADPAPGFYSTVGPCFDATQYLDAAGTARTADDPTFSYTKAIPSGNGFAALHPSHKFLAPLYNAGHLQLIHRVGYPKQSRSHFDSQNYWENGNPNNNLVKDGMLYRAMIESGLTSTNALTGVSIQSSLPLLLRGSAAAMTNLSDVNRYQLLGIPGGPGFDKAEAALGVANDYPFVDKKNREMLKLQYQNLMNTLPLFDTIRAQLGINFLDDGPTDNDFRYNLFPSSNATNGGYARPGGGNDPAKYVVDTNAYRFFTNLKAAALVLNKTDTIVAGTEMVDVNIDTHSAQGALTGSHPNLQRRVAWALYALRKYFMLYADKVQWKDLVVVTLSEFGRTTVENADAGTDHAEAGVTFVAGGGIKGYNSGSPTGAGVIGCSPGDSVPWVPGPANQGGSVDGSMFGVSDRYLKRAVDYRSVFGEIFRKHLGATQPQVNRIIPGYADTKEKLLSGGTSGIDGTPIMGELGIL